MGKENGPRNRTATIEAQECFTCHHFLMFPGIPFKALFLFTKYQTTITRCIGKIKNDQNLESNWCSIKHDYIKRLFQKSVVNPRLYSISFPAACRSLSKWKRMEAFYFFLFSSLFLLFLFLLLPHLLLWIHKCGDRLTSKYTWI